MKFQSRKLKLGELIQFKALYFKLYVTITEFDKILELEEKVVEPIEKIVKTYEKKMEQLRADLAADPSKQEALDKILNEILNSDVSIKLAEVSKEIVEQAKLNVFEYRVIKDLITPAETK